MARTDIDRRNFLRNAARLGGGALIAPSLVGLAACADQQGIAAPDFDAQLGVVKVGGTGAYGDLKVVNDFPEISIPPGFHAVKLGQTGDLLADGNVLKNAFDGMGAFSMGGNRVRLVRNHEMRNGPGQYAPLSPTNAYDPTCNAGNTTVEVTMRPDGAVSFERAWVSLSGTAVNCAGGETPWGSWISCEETVVGTNAGYQQNHGYNFEIPASANSPVTPVPLKAMGRFVHEAVAVDPDTWWVYQTEDRNPSGFYRFIPNVRGQLAQGGKLEMLKVKGAYNYDTRTNQTVGALLDCEWVLIDEPDTDTPAISSGFVFNQGGAKGGAQFARLEGCWWGDNSVYFNATSGGNAGAGQVWRYIPDAQGGKLVLVFESPSTSVLNSPDNICISPRGGIVICEDGAGTNFVRGITRQGTVFDFVRNNINTSEWAGACFSPQGRTLFVNLQGSTSEASSPWGATYAIWGPWEKGAL